MPPNTTKDIQAFLNDHWLPGVADQISDMSALMKILMKSQGITGLIDPTKPGLSKMVTGGDRIKKSLRHTRATSRGSFKDYSLLKTTPNNQFDYALYDWSSYYVSVPMSFNEEMAARGVEEVLQYEATKLAAAVGDMMDLIATGLYNNAAALTGSWNDQQGYGIHGLREVCTSSNTYASIDRSTYTWFNPGLYATTPISLANLVDDTSANYIWKVLRAGLNACRKAGREPTHIIVSPAVFDLLEDTILHSKVFLGNVQSADVGYKFINHRGVEIVREETTYLPDAYHVFFLNINGGTLEFVGRAGAWFMLTDRIPSQNQMANIRYLVCQCALTCIEPRLLGLNTGVGNG